VQKAFWYGFRNVFFLNDNASDREANFGLVRSDYSPKPALRALVAYAGGHGARAVSGARRVHTSLAVRRADIGAHIAAVSSLRVRSHWLTGGDVSGARAGRITLLVSRWSAHRHRWVRVARLHPHIGSAGHFAARVRTNFRASYRVRAFYRHGSVRGASRSRVFHS